MTGGQLTVESTLEDEEDNEFFRSIQLLFYQTYQGKCEEIAKALETGDIKLAHRLAHTLKGNAGQIEESVLQKAAEEIEHNLKDGENRTTAQQTAALENELKAVISKLETELKPEIEQAEKRIFQEVSSADSLKTRELFDKLESLLKSGNTGCLELISDLRTVPGSEILAQQIEGLEFEEALRTLEKLRN